MCRPLQTIFDAFAASPIKRDIKINRATHLMHLETMRFALYQETITFLLAGDEAPMPPVDGNHRR